MLLVSCSSGPSVDDACAQEAAALCDKIDLCVKNATTLFFTDKPTCVSRAKSDCVATLGAADIDTSPDDVVACATALPNASCDDALANKVTACDPKPGKRATGAACADDAQCQSTYCAIVKGTNCGTCAAPSSAGDSCATSSCSRGLKCNDKTSTCQPDGASGASCDEGHPCGYRLSCVTPIGMSTGSCQAAPTTLGASCDVRQRNAPECDYTSALTCGVLSNTCEAATYTGAGGACGLVGIKIVFCNAASICFGAMGATPGVCKALALEGQACDDTNGPACMAPARCVGGSCALPDPGRCGG
jgi:hypothetical protein